MNQSLLIQLAVAGGDIGALAQNALAGDRAALSILPDALYDADKEQLMKLQVGKNYLIMTVTHYFTGEVFACDLAEVVLVKGAWIPDTGRFNEIFKNGEVAECEPLPEDVKIHINMGGIIAAPEWPAKLPRRIK